MIHEYNIKGTAEVYTIAVSSCSQNGNWDFACRVYDDMTRKGVVPDEVTVLYNIMCLTCLLAF